jgi:UPF0042 nucleotide-binding protein
LDLVVISGLSGSGKSIALRALEDLGYYCVDNLPAGLLSAFAGHFRDRPATTRAAVSIDSRSREPLDALPARLDELRAGGLECRVIFLSAQESVLIKRYSETRRKHPLTDAGTVLAEGIRREQELLAPLCDAAALHLDTTHMAAQELRSRIRAFADAQAVPSLSLLFESFGYKHGTPGDADIVFDVRCLPNPYWRIELRHLSGRDPAVIRYLEEQPSVADMVTRIRAFLEHWLPAFRAEARTYITVAVGCTGGQHRSVYIAERLAREFSGAADHVQIRHRELPGASLP